MFVKVLKSKLHRAKVTETKLNYPGSIAIDEDLMKMAEITPYEIVLIADVDNGNRLQTYAIPAPAGSGGITILGAAAKRIEKNDIIIIFSFLYCSTDEAKNIKPKVLILDEDNKVKKTA